MKDPETLGCSFFFALFGLTIVILVMGISVKSRMARESVVADSSILGTVIVVVLALVLAFYSTFTPFLAALPVLGFLIRGVQALGGRDVLDRKGGIVIILTGVAWALFTGVQAAFLAWGATVSGPIRVDIGVTIPAMALVSAFGWWIQGSLPVERLTRPSTRPGAARERPVRGPAQP